jgi:two-component system sensor histidine kinase GlrK
MKTAIRIVTWYAALLVPLIALILFAVSGITAVLALVAAAIISFFATVRITRLERENVRLRAQAGSVEQVKKDFISHVSHEIKAPLASMQETTHLMIERIPGPLTEKQGRLLQLNLQSGKRLARMIGNLLDISRLQAGVVDYDMGDHDIAEILRNVVVDLDVESEEKTRRIVMDIAPEPLLVHCDPNRMVQLFNNLIDNALRFSPRECSVTVHASFQKTLQARMSARIHSPSVNRISEGFALIVISDSGTGIEDAHKERVFTTFHQVRQGKKTMGQSLGLGLAISRSVVDAHKGAIWVEDNPEGGSIFFVVLPHALAAAKQLDIAS